MHMTILLVEDDVKAARLLCRGLEEEGFEVSHAASAEEGLEKLQTPCQLVILDWNLPGMSGADMCSRLRESGSTVPVLMLTARDAMPDRIHGLNAGADDYLVKPYVFEELLARVRAMIRRAGFSGSPSMRAYDLELDPVGHIVRRNGKMLTLTRKEYALVEYMMQHKGELITRQQLADRIWNADLIAIDNLIDVHIKNLRKKMDIDGLPELIRTVRGRGFKLDVTD